MRNKILIILLLLSFTFSASAQYFEVGLLGGGSNYIGDLSKNSSKIFLEETQFAGGLFLGYNYNALSFKLGGNYAEISGKDANSTNLEVKTRNLSFSSIIIEGYFRAEWNIGGFSPYNNDNPFAPFIFAGIAGNYYDPITEYKGSTIQLRGLGTEGQGLSAAPNKYGTIAISIPMGVGVKYAIKESITLGFEIGGRFAFTDYLDDVGETHYDYAALLQGNGKAAADLSNRTGELGDFLFFPAGAQRGDNNKHDWYLIAGLSISYNFIDNGLMSGRRRRSRSKSGCKID